MPKNIINKKGKFNSSKLLPKKVAVLYSDDDPKYFKTPEEHLTVAEAYEDALRFEPFLKKLNIKSTYIKADSKLTQTLHKEKPDMALNLVTTVKGSDYLGATIPAVLELMEIPYTGTNLTGFTLGSNKYVIHALLKEHGVPVPNFQLLKNIDDPIDTQLKYPLILKLNEEHSNLEITSDSVVEEEGGLRKRVKYLMDVYKQEILVSEFIEGREFAAFLVDLEDKEVFAKERIFNIPGQDPRFKFMDYKLAWESEEHEYVEWLKQEKYSDPKLTEFVKKAFDVCRMDQYGKFDIRMDKTGNYYFIDANANCYFAPPDMKYDSDIARTMEMYNISFESFFERLLKKTMRGSVPRE